jgi:hypothetical protein
VAGFATNPKGWSRLQFLRSNVSLPLATAISPNRALRSEQVPADESLGVCGDLVLNTPFKVCYCTEQRLRQRTPLATQVCRVPKVFQASDAPTSSATRRMDGRTRIQTPKFQRTSRAPRAPRRDKCCNLQANMFRRAVLRVYNFRKNCFPVTPRCSGPRNSIR